MRISVSHGVFFYDKPLKNRHASADICAASLEYSMYKRILLWKSPCLLENLLPVEVLTV